MDFNELDWYQDDIEEVTPSTDLHESKADQQLLINHVGADLADRFNQEKLRLSGRQKDLYYWLDKSPAELSAALNKLGKSRREEKRDGAEKLYDKDGWKVYHITSYSAAKYYGENTKWCISGSYAGNEAEGLHFFDEYSDAEFYFIMSPDPMKKWCYLDYGAQQAKHATKQFWDALDKPHETVLELPAEVLAVLPDNGTLRPAYTVVDGTIYFNVTPNGTLPFIQNSDKLKIKHAALPDTISLIENECFKSCMLLSDIKIPDSVVKLDFFAFGYCANLTSVYLPDSLKEIGMGVFTDCSRLKSIFIPASVEKINPLVFSKCFNLTIYCGASERPAGWAEDFNKSFPKRFSDYMNGKVELPVVWGASREMAEANL